MQVVDQFCVLSEEGDFFELITVSMASSPIPISTRSRQSRPSTGTGYDIMFMLYRALRDYLKGEEELVDALEKVIGYVFA